MEKFNKNSLKAAVKNYGSLYTEGKTEEEVKAALLADEKGYSEEQVDLIYEAIVNPEAPKEAKSYKVSEGMSFRDKDDFSKEYNDESDISSFDKDRIDHLVSIGYVEES